MNLKILVEGKLGYNVTLITRSGNKLQGEIIKSPEDTDILKLKTDDGIIIVNADAIESIY